MESDMSDHRETSEDLLQLVRNLEASIRTGRLKHQLLLIVKHIEELEELVDQPNLVKDAAVFEPDFVVTSNLDVAVYRDLLTMARKGHRIIKIGKLIVKVMEYVP